VPHTVHGRSGRARSESPALPLPTIVSPSAESIMWSRLLIPTEIFRFSGNETRIRFPPISQNRHKTGAWANCRPVFAFAVAGFFGPANIGYRDRARRHVSVLPRPRPHGRVVPDSADASVRRDRASG